MARPRKTFPPSVEAEVIRLSVEMEWSDEKIRKWLEETHAIKVSRVTVQRCTSAGRGPEKPVADPDIMPVPLVDQEQLDKVQANLFRAAQIAFSARRFQDQARCAQELLKFVQARGKPTALYPAVAPSTAAPQGAGGQPELSQAEIDRIAAQDRN